VDLAEDIGYDLSQMDLTVTGAVLLKYYITAFVTSSCNDTDGI